MLQLVSWLKRKRRLAVAQPTSQNKKAHAQPVTGEFDAHTNAWDRKKKKKRFSEGEHRDMTMSVAA